MEIYHDDQFFRESEAIPPAPKLGAEKVPGGPNVGSANATIGNGMKYDTGVSDDTFFEGRTFKFYYGKQNGTQIKLISDATGLFNIYIVLTAIVLILMVLIMLVIGRIVLMKRKSRTPETKLHECSAGISISVKEHRTDDGISLDSDLNSTDLTSMPRDDVREHKFA